MIPTELERFEAKIFYSPDGCHYWTACHHDYGVFQKGGKALMAHRAAYTLYKGSIPEGLWVLHRCDNRLCVNPDHLFLGSAKDNTQDMIKKGRRGWTGSRARTHCEKGHALTFESTYGNGGGLRVCRICQKERRRKQRLKKSGLII